MLQRVAAAADGSLYPHDQNLRERLPTSNVASLERELAGEIAYSLGRAGTKLDEAIARVRATLLELAELGVGTPERETLLERYWEERGAAERRLRDLLIQREAIGLRRHNDVFQRYVIPSLPPRE